MTLTYIAIGESLVKMLHKTVDVLNEETNGR